MSCFLWQAWLIGGQRTYCRIVRAWVKSPPECIGAQLKTAIGQ